MNRSAIKKLIMLTVGCTVFGLALAIAVNFTGAFNLERVEVDGAVIEDWSTEFDLLADAPIGSQPIDSLAKIILSQKRVHKVDISLDLPSVIEIETNQFDPLCFILDKVSGRTYALDNFARVVPIVDDNGDWEKPIIAGIECGKLFSRCYNGRVSVIVPQLQRLQEENIDLFHLIDELNLSRPGYVIVSVAGLDYKLHVRAASLFDDLARFTEFVTKYAPDLEGTAYLDFRQNDMIIRRSKRG